ncbi:MAG TPA: type II CAAX endopeptidase family protein [Anaerolineales bacterium]|nr:type II CAAX endopeptidase family protein [Anaerolineales bacterium]
MNLESQQPDSPEISVPWSLSDSWLAVAMLALIDVILLVITLRGSRTQIVQGAGIVLLELAYLLPVVVILAWKRVHWKFLGFRNFEPKAMALGCGLLIAGYSIILLHNFILLRLGVDTQGEAILRLIQTLESPFWFFLVGVLFAPFVEEIFFRGFLFQGFRQRYGWVRAALLSSAIFAVAHLDPVSLIPTFILGLVLAFLYQRANSLWPGIILHLLVNGASLCAAFVYTRLPPEILSGFWLIG